jgi:hypothetical protein
MKCNAVELEDNKACFTAKVSPLSGQKTGRLARDLEGKTSYTPRGGQFADKQIQIFICLP